MTFKYRHNLLEEKLKSMDITISFFKRIWQATSNLIWFGLWTFALGLLLWYPLRWWPGDSFWPVRFTNYFMPWLLLGLIPGFGLAIAAGRRRLAAALALPTLLITLTFAPLFLPQPRTALAGQESFKVMSYNIWGWNHEPEAMIKLIKQEQPDILLLQEVPPRLGRLLSSQLTDLYPDAKLHLVYKADIGQAILSRYPLTEVEESYRKGRILKVLADTPAGQIAVWDAHPFDPLPWRPQYRQISALVEDIAATHQPLILAGDFNTTDQSQTYRMINQYLHNAHWEAGWGFGFSFPSTEHRLLHGKLPLPALVRIDHIFYSDHFFARSARTLSEAGGSDHFPVVAELSRVN